MKTIIIFLLFFLALNTKLGAQGNLQFNKVKTLTGTIPGQTSLNLDTVPAGKVWKIESIGLSPLFLQIGGYACSETFFAINGVEFVNHAPRVSNSNLVVLNNQSE
jgi:hypothetical protein